VPRSAKETDLDAVLAGTDLVHGYMHYDPAERGAAAIARVRREIRAFAPDVVVYLAEQSSRLRMVRHIAFFMSCGIMSVVGMPEFGADGHHLFDPAVGLWESEAAFLLRRLHDLGPASIEDPSLWDLGFTADERAAAAAALADFPGATDFVAIAPGAKVEAKDWGAANWTALAARLAARHPQLGLVTVGGPADRARAAALAAVWRGPWRDLCGAVAPRADAGEPRQRSHASRGGGRDAEHGGVQRAGEAGDLVSARRGQPHPPSRRLLRRLRARGLHGRAQALHHRDRRRRGCRRLRGHSRRPSGRRRTFMSTEPLRLAYLVTHPIQYQAPLLRRVAAQPDIHLTAFFATDFSARSFKAHDFAQQITWDVPLLQGYDHEVLKRLDKGPPEGIEPILGFWSPLSHGIGAALDRGRFDALWIHGYARWHHWCAIAAAKRRGIKVLLRDEATPISAQRGALKTAAKRGFFGALGLGVDAFLAIGTLNRRYYEQNGISPERISLVPYAVDNAHFRKGAEDAAPRREALRAELGLEPGRPILLSCGKLIARKRPLELVEAFARVHADPALRRPILVFAGDGPLRAEVEARAQGLAPDAVRVLGFVPQSRLPATYDLCDAFILPSGQEAWGLVVNEVMCAGRAVIVSDMVGCAPDLVRPGENGAIFPTDDIAAMAQAIRDVMGDPRRLAAMGRRSLEIVSHWGFAEDIAGLRAALARICPGRIDPVAREES
jgi:glycosyltransferase involved in cell wall biosynthesis